jgi:hypothetical protein
MHSTAVGMSDIAVTMQTEISGAPARPPPGSRGRSSREAAGPGRRSHAPPPQDLQRLRPVRAGVHVHMPAIRRASWAERRNCASSSTIRMRSVIRSPPSSATGVGSPRGSRPPRGEGRSVPRGAPGRSPRRRESPSPVPPSSRLVVKNGIEDLGEVLRRDPHALVLHFHFHESRLDESGSASRRSRSFDGKRLAGVGQEVHQDLLELLGVAPSSEGPPRRRSRSRTGRWTCGPGSPPGGATTGRPAKGPRDGARTGDCAGRSPSVRR